MSINTSNSIAIARTYNSHPCDKRLQVPHKSYIDIFVCKRLIAYKWVCLCAHTSKRWWRINVINQEYRNDKLSNIDKINWKARRQTSVDVLHIPYKYIYIGIYIHLYIYTCVCVGCLKCQEKTLVIEKRD